MVRQNETIASVGVSPPTFLSLVPFVIASSTKWSEAIHAEVSLAQRNPPALAGGSSAWTTGIGV
jgi:hypothetical protein